MCRGEGGCGRRAEQLQYIGTSSSGLEDVPIEKNVTSSAGVCLADDAMCFKVLEDITVVRWAAAICSGIRGH